MTFAPSVLEKAEWPPNYIDVFGWRQMRLWEMENDPRLMYGCLTYYHDRPIDWICHWVDTYDPRNALIDLPTFLPFVLFRRQAELISFILACLNDQESGLIDKSRDTGVTWLCVALSVWLWRYHPGAAIGWGSRKQDLVDKIGDLDSIFEKIRRLIWRLPRFFWPRGFSPEKHMGFMKIINPENAASITGEAGDAIGRGGRKLIYFKDESAHYEHPESIEASLGDNTRVQIDISTTAGVGTVFDRKREAGQLWIPDETPARGKLRVFVLDWSDHPAKTQMWHDVRERAAREQGLLAVFRQEVDRDPASSVQGIICPQEWVRAAVDAHLKLKFADEGRWIGALDVADEGGDLNALALRKGVILRVCDDWGEGDTGKTARRAVYMTRMHLPIDVQYDCVGVGAGIKAETNRLKAEGSLPKGMHFSPWNAGAAVVDPEKRVIAGDPDSPMQKDFYANLSAQAWWALRRRFELTYRAINEENFKYSVADLISIDGTIPKLRQLMRELSQPVMTHDGRLRLSVDKKPEGSRSPNMADAVRMAYFPLITLMNITPAVLEWSRKRA